MPTEQLVIELNAKTQELDAKLKATESRLEGLEKSTRKADGSLLKMAKAGGKVDRDWETSCSVGIV